MLIINANIKTMEDEDFPKGYIFVSDGKIQSVGPMSEAPPDEDVYDALQLHTCVNGRKVYGGPSAESVTQQIELIEDFIAKSSGAAAGAQA